MRNERGKQLLNGPLQALQQAGLHQAAARYQLVQAQLAAHVMPPVCPAEDAFLLLVGLPNLVVAHGVQLTGEPVLDQLHRLLNQVDAWACYYPAQKQPIRLLALWLDKLLRLAPASQAKVGRHGEWLVLGSLELRCLGHLDTPWREWAWGASALMPSAHGIAAALSLALQALSREAQDNPGLVWLMVRTAGEGSTLTECAVLLYGALAGWQYRLAILPLVEDKTRDDDEGRPGIMKNSPKTAYSSELKSES